MPLKKLILLIILCFSLFSTKAGKINEGFDALLIHDYFKAKKLFYAELNKKKQAAAYGLATIFFRNNNPFHNIDSAAKYISLSGYSFKKNRLKETYASFTIDSSAIYSLADSIASKAIIKTYKTNTTTEYEHFLTSHVFANSNIRNGVYYLRDELNFKNNLSYNTSDSTRLFILRFPESYFISDYFSLLDKQIFEESTPLKTKDQLMVFIKRNQKNKYILQAQDELFEVLKTTNDKKGLDFFVKNYPESNSINEAWKLLFSLNVTSYNDNELKTFIALYPGFPFKASIKKEIELNAKILIPYTDNDYTGFIDTSGKFVIPPVYEAVTPFKEGLSLVIKNDTSFFINKENTNVFNAFYEEAWPFTNGIAPVSKNGVWFFINRQGQKISDEFEEISEPSENIYVIKQHKKYGALDAYGNLIIQPQFEKLGDFKNGMAYYMNNGHYGFVSKNGSFSKSPYQWVSDFDDKKIAVIKKNNLYGLTNSNDELILDPKYDLIVKAKNNIFIVVKNNKYGFYSGMGCFISEIDYDYKKELSADYYTNGRLFKLIKNKQEALMDANGRISIDFNTYEEVNFAQDNLIKIKRKNKYGFVDRKLNQVIACKYNSASDFQDSISICTLKQEVVLINIKDEVVYKTKGNITRLNNGYFWVEDENNKLLNKKGKLLFSQIITYSFSGNSYLILEFENKLKKVLKL